MGGFRTTRWDDLERAKNGDNEAWRRFYEDYYRPVVFTVRKHLGGASEETAEAIAHDVLSTFHTDNLLERALEYRRDHPDERFGKFLFRRVWYAIHNHLKAKKGGCLADDHEAPDDHDEFAALWACNNIFVPSIRELRNAYAAEDRQNEYAIFLERFFYRNKPAKIAKAQNMDPKQISKIAQRAAERLRAIIEKRLERRAARNDLPCELLKKEFVESFTKMGPELFERLTTISYEMLFANDVIPTTTTSAHT